MQTSVALMAEREKERRQAGKLHSMGHSKVKETQQGKRMESRPLLAAGPIAFVYAQYRPVTFGRRHCEQSMHSTASCQLERLPEVGV